MIDIIVQDTDTGDAVVATVVDYDYRPNSRPLSGTFLKMDIETAITDLAYLRQQNEQSTGQATSEV